MLVQYVTDFAEFSRMLCSMSFQHSGCGRTSSGPLKNMSHVSSQFSHEKPELLITKNFEVSIKITQFKFNIFPQSGFRHYKGNG